MHQSDFFTVQQLAEFFGISEKAMRSRIFRDAKNLPPTFRFGRTILFRKIDVFAWVESRKQENVSEVKS